MMRSNVYAAGAPLASYDGQGVLHYAINDWQGTKRMQVSFSTVACPMFCTSG